MANTASISANIAGRYAQAVFDLVKDQGGLDALATQVDSLGTALKDSADLRTLIGSALYSREQQENAITAIAAKMGLSPLLTNTLRLMAQNRRLFALPQLVARTFHVSTAREDTFVAGLSLGGFVIFMIAWLTGRARATA